MKRSFIILLHAGYWMLFLLLVSCFIMLAPGAKHYSFGQLLAALFLSPIGINIVYPGITGFYTFYLFLFTAFLSKKKILMMCLSGTAVCVLTALLCIFTSAVILHTYKAINDWSEKISIVCFLSLLVLIHGIIGLVMRGFISWYADIKLKEELTARNFEAELALVKSQINPHFLFNSINNIDVLIMKDAALASAFLNKLSGIMRFMLYETKTERIALTKELAYIENYIELQKIRTSNADYIRYKIEGETTGIMIAPMLFIPFIENAFKHANKNRTGNVINILLQVKNSELVFTCRNVYTATTKEGSGGLGNDLIKKRLNLLYPNRHTLVITDGNNIYETKLTLFFYAD